MKAKIVNKYSIEVIDYDKEVEQISKAKEEYIKKFGITEEFTLSLITKKADEIEKEQLSKFDEYKEFVPCAYKGEISDTDSVIPYYELESGKIVQKWEVVKNDSSKIRSKISELKSLLDSSDYKIIKSYENFILGSETSDEIKKIIERRKGWRCEINRLEELLKKD